MLTYISILTALHTISSNKYTIMFTCSLSHTNIPVLNAISCHHIILFNGQIIMFAYLLFHLEIYHCGKPPLTIPNCQTNMQFYMQEESDFIHYFSLSTYHIIVTCSAGLFNLSDWSFNNLNENNKLFIILFHHPVRYTKWSKLRCLGKLPACKDWTNVQNRR